MKTLTKCLPLTQEDILILRGKPVAKRIESSQSQSKQLEQWIYYTPIIRAGLSGDTKEECFIFKNGKLVGYKTEKAI
jgi:hypothetical protein